MNLLEDNNYQIDTSSQGSKVMKKLIDNQKTLMTEPRSISNVVTQTLELKPNVKYFNNNTQNYAVLSVDPLVGGFPSYAVSPAERNFMGYFLQNPLSQLKANNIKEIICSCFLASNYNIEAYSIPIPVATSDYSVKYYVTLQRYDDPLFGVGNFIEDNYFFFTFTFAYTKLTDTWSVSSTSQTLFLADTFNRPTITYLSTDYKDFATNSNKITPEQYILFTSQAQNLYIQSSFSRTEASVLSGVSFHTWKTTPSNSNKAHFEACWGEAGATHDYSSLYLLSLNLNFNYFGLLTPYTPNS